MDDRNKIEVLNKEGYSARKIATILGFHHSTISRELNRCKDFYHARDAQAKRNELSKLKGRKKKITNNLKSIIETHLDEAWSPEQIVGRLLNGILSFKTIKTIYNWIYANVLNVNLTSLRRKGKSRKPTELRGKFNIGTSISNRPKYIKERTEFGH